MIEVKYLTHLDKTEMPPPRTVWYYKSTEWEGPRAMQYNMLWRYTSTYLQDIWPHRKLHFTKECNLAGKCKIESILSHHNGIREFWTLAKHVNNNMNDRSLSLPLSLPLSQALY